ncbi:MAG: helix-turn-helix domain-containing protein, partial [Oscillospiraceae bacterium]|nr:helix-turn-helix domain-containing protein [Oscillospiraceae bacterium]
MRLFRLSNHIFKLRLDTKEIAVYAYLCSLPAACSTLQGKAVISVKQQTIAANCGIKSPVTISKTIDRLREKGLVD